MHCLILETTNLTEEITLIQMLSAGDFEPSQMH